MKWSLLVLGLMLAQSAQAQYLGTIPAQVLAGGTLTKVAEDDYLFSFEWSWGNYYMPSGGIDPFTGYPVGYSPYFAGIWYGIGTPPGTYEWSEGFGFGNGGYFRSTDAPTILNLYADQWIEGQVQYPNGINGRIIVGDLVGQATLLGDVPTEIGQSTAWAQTPEPATFCLLGLGLLGIAIVRRRVA